MAISVRPSIHGSARTTHNGEAGAPALVGFLDLAAERLGHDLMTEADADHLAVPAERMKSLSGAIHGSGS